MLFINSSIKIKSEEVYSSQSKIITKSPITKKQPTKKQINKYIINK